MATVRVDKLHVDDEIRVHEVSYIVVGVYRQADTTTSLQVITTQGQRRNFTDWPNDHLVTLTYCANSYA